MLLAPLGKLFLFCAACGVLSCASASLVRIMCSLRCVAWRPFRSSQACLLEMQSNHNMLTYLEQVPPEWPKRGERVAAHIAC